MNIRQIINQHFDNDFMTGLPLIEKEQSLLLSAQIEEEISRLTHSKVSIEAPFGKSINWLIYYIQNRGTFRLNAVEANNTRLRTSYAVIKKLWKLGYDPVKENVEERSLILLDKQQEIEEEKHVLEKLIEEREEGLGFIEQLLEELK